MTIDLSNYNVYTCKDGRTRAYNKTTHAVTSFPRVLMEQILGRPLLKTEDVHHKDGNPLNNDPDNLEVVDHMEHEKLHGEKNRKYYDKIMLCPVCNNPFIWTAYSQQNYNGNINRKTRSNKHEILPPFCSKSCANKYSASVQFRHTSTEDILADKMAVCPICNKTFTWSKTSQWRFKHGINEIPKPCCSRECVHAYRKQLNLKNKNNKTA